MSYNILYIYIYIYIYMHVYDDYGVFTVHVAHMRARKRLHW